MQQQALYQAFLKDAAISAPHMKMARKYNHAQAGTYVMYFLPPLGS